MELKEALALVNQAFDARCGREINDLEADFFKRVWQGLTYGEIAEQLGYAPGTIARNVAPRFWRLLSEALVESERGVGKSNFREQLKRYQERISELVPPLPIDSLIENNEFKAFNLIIDTIKAKKKEIDVITISANNYDFFIKVDKISPEHESVILDESFACAGGSGANTVCGLSKLRKKTAIVGCVKNDFEGEKLFESFRDFSVDTEFLIIDNTNERNTKTGITTILVEKISARRQILVAPGINNYLSEILRENNEQRLKSLIAKVNKSKIIHLSSFAGRAEMELQLTVLNYLRNKNIDTIVSLTPGAIYVEEGLDGLNKIIACTNILFLYIQQLDRLLELSSEIEHFNSHLSLEDKIKLLFKWRIENEMTHPLIVVIKNYSRTRKNNIYRNHILVASHFENCVSFFIHSNRRSNEPRNTTVIPEDSTGTGDALAAGFLYGILEGKDIETCTDCGFIISTEVSQRLGARSNLPDKIH